MLVIIDARNKQQGNNKKNILRASITHRHAHTHTARTSAGGSVGDDEEEDLRSGALGIRRFRGPCSFLPQQHELSPTEMRLPGCHWTFFRLTQAPSPRKHPPRVDGRVTSRERESRPQTPSDAATFRMENLRGRI